VDTAAIAPTDLPARGLLVRNASIVFPSGSMNGLILVGGQSVRMGTDKSQLSYHGKPQWQYLYDLLLPFCQKTYLSCRQNQKDNFTNCPLLIDTYETGL
jgi:molybdopterin-guanine dinucleotide biosynthesis protein A